jgi:AcrR family transcriptional regulator
MYVCCAMTPTAKRRARQPHQLPPGRHGLPRSFVASNQRQRILAAVADVASLAGYGSMSVEGVIATAGVSRRTFYDNFADKDEAFLAAYDAVVALLVTRVQQAFAANGTFAGRVRDCLAACLTFLA